MVQNQLLKVRMFCTVQLLNVSLFAHAAQCYRFPICEGSEDTETDVKHSKTIASSGGGGSADVKSVTHALQSVSLSDKKNKK